MKNDLPYYSGEPVAIAPAGWTLIIAAVLAAFLLLTALPFPSPPLNFLPAILFTGLPLLALMAVTGWRMPAIFGRLGFKELGLGLGFGVLTTVVSSAIGFTVANLIGASANPAVQGLQTLGTTDLLLFLMRTIIQLIGEEAVTILPLLAVLWICVSEFGLSRRVGLVIAVTASTLWFAAMHLPTYNWNFLQCLGIIGSARIVLTLAYLVTRNMWVSSIAHIINDWTLFLTAFALGHLPVGVDG